MNYALPHPHRSLAIPLAALALGAAGGTTAALIIADDDPIVRGSAPAVQVRALPQSGAFPTPERVSPAPPTSSLAGTTAPVPERVSPAPPADTSSGDSEPFPERIISGAHTR